MDNTGFPVVGIGASAGGIEAFHRFFDHLPADTGMAFVVILHLPADRKSMLTDILQRWTAMRVVDAEDGTRVEPDCVYVPPPHSVVTLADGRLRVQPSGPGEHHFFRPIDSFFDSLGTVLRERAVGIVLSGTGSDGALGLKVIKECGGLTIAQGSQGSAPEYPGMPGAAIATGSVDLVTSVEDIPAELRRLRGSRLSQLDTPRETSEETEAARLQICALLRARVGHDFSGYRDKTFLRRVQRRMQVVGAPTLQAYIGRLNGDTDEAGALFRDLLISVTRFFRDQDIFHALQTQVIPRLFANKQADSLVRIWVPGCATGEEAYSLAILLREHMDQLRWTPKVQLFATDIDQAAINTARLGRYPGTLLEGLTQERRQRFFQPAQTGFVVTREIRELCTFSDHNLLRDPPLSKMDLVSCRNLLIYLDTQAQEKVIPLFHYALRPGGILVLGGTESVARHQDLFDPLDRVSRIFIKRDVKSPSLPFRPDQLAGHLGNPAVRAGQTPQPGSVLSHFAARHPPDAAAARLPAQDASPVEVEARPRHGGWRGLARPLNTMWRALSGRTPAFRELQVKALSTQEALMSLKEEYQNALEDLRSANEELHSLNEELQSSNEEL